jgi:hypothetical protein
LDEGRTELVQRARFLPKGLWGITYWYLLDPWHRWMYKGMLTALARATGKAVLQGPERERQKI